MAKEVTVKGVEIRYATFNDANYICLTDMMKAKDGDFFIGYAIATRWNISAFGSRYTIRILIMANSPQLEAKRD